MKTYDFSDSEQRQAFSDDITKSIHEYHRVLCDRSLKEWSVVIDGSTIRVGIEVMKFHTWWIIDSGKESILLAPEDIVERN